MTLLVLAQAERDLDDAFDFYEARQSGLGGGFLLEFREATNRILRHPLAWHPLDATYRRCRLHRFPYGVIYRVDDASQQIIVQAVQHLRRHPDRRRHGT